MAKPKASELVAKIEEAKGNISAVARAYHVSRTAVYQWIDSYESAKQALADQREIVIDVAESKLFQKVEDGQDNAIFYVLNNAKEARARGWGIRQTDITSGGDSLKVLIEYADIDDNTT